MGICVLATIFSAIPKDHLWPEKCHCMSKVYLKKKKKARDQKRSGLCGILPSCVGTLCLCGGISIVSFILKVVAMQSDCAVMCSRHRCAKITRPLI